MPRLGGKRLYLLVAVVLLTVAALIAYIGGADRGVLGLWGEPPPELSETTSEVSIEVHVTLPDRAVGREQSFRAEGVVDYLNDRAQMTYDFGGLTNAAGFLGHLERFGVFFTEDGMFVEIFRDGPPWILFEPIELVELRIERLREVALSSPVMLPLLLEDMREKSQRRRALDLEVEVDGLQANGETQAKLLELFEDLGVDTIPVRAELEEGFPVMVRQELRFPVTEGSNQDVIVTIKTALSQAASADIAPPARGQYRTMAEFQSGPD